MEALRAVVTEENREEVLLSLIHSRDRPEVDEDPEGNHLDVAPIIGNTADVAYQLRQIGQIMEEVKAFKAQAEEARFFYERRIEALEFRAEFLKENIGRWLKANNLKKLATHAGTIYFSKRTKVTLPSDEELLEFAITEDPSNQMGLYRTALNKAEIKEYIASSGRKPEGYAEEQTEAITIRKVS